MGQPTRLTDQIEQGVQEKVSKRTENVVRNLTEAKNAKLRRVEDLAAVMDPLSRAMAEMTDEAAGWIRSFQTEAMNQQKQAAANWSEAAKQLHEPRKQIQNAASEAKQAARETKKAASQMNGSPVRTGLVVGISTGTMLFLLMFGALWLWPSMIQPSGSPSPSTITVQNQQLRVVTSTGVQKGNNGTRWVQVKPATSE